MSATIPQIDKRLAAVCQRLRGLAAEIEEKWHFGVVHLLVEDQVIQARSLEAADASHRGWRIEVPVPELDDYIGQPEDGELVPLPLSIEETSLMLRRVVEECRGVRGIASPCAPNPELLQDILDLLKRQSALG